jgi:hypothetical protein
MSLIITIYSVKLIPSLHSCIDIFRGAFSKIESNRKPFATEDTESKRKRETELVTINTLKILHRAFVSFFRGHAYPIDASIPLGKWLLGSLRVCLSKP